MISTAKLIEELGYDSSPNFLAGESLAASPGFAHVFRRAAERCGLAGVYTLRQNASAPDGSLVPIVYVCEAASEEDACQVHRQVWNQNVVPFLVVRTPQNVRVYSGFGYHETRDSPRRSATRILNEAITASELGAKLLTGFHADRIDDGTLWRERGEHVTPDARVDWRLLENLERLGTVLRDDMELGPHAAHALIGKYVYLRYLRDRGILSDERLASFDVEARKVFSRCARLSALRSLIGQLDDWINGSIFDIPWADGIKAEHVKQVAGAFFGDDPQTGQLNLYEDYDFSYIPIETLSVVYEQFLHSQGKARDEGAYYTPIPLVNFVLDELESHCPLQRGMRVLDPSCGSGAFLVQCYRRLIEKELAARKGAKILPSELRSLLQDHIFGIDRDEDACQVTELSLTLTLLDYVEPPDLTKTNFKLPVLRGANVFGGPKEDFFNLHSDFHRTMGEEGFDWIVGNPPWTELSTELPRAEDTCVAEWQAENQRHYPTGGNQVAELFAWKATEHVHRQGNIGLLLPAMTLFKSESTSFRKAFFRDLKVHSVVNFANMAYVLFAGRAEVPAAAFFYQLRDDAAAGNHPSDRILTFAPFVVNQEPNRPRRFNRKVNTWSVVVNGSEIREIDVADAMEGDGLTWKLAMWGSHRDRRLLQRVADRFRALHVEQESRQLTMLEGFQLRSRDAKDPTIFVEELIGKAELLTKAISQYGRVFSFPDDVLQPIERDRAYLRVRGGQKPIAVCRPPHVIVQASRNYAVFSDEFVVVPPRQIGVAGPPGQSDFLKVLSLYLNSDFAQYHQFLTAPQWGVSFNRVNLDTLKALPIPLAQLDRKDLSEWLALHSQLSRIAPTRKTRASRSARKGSSPKQRLLFGDDAPEDPMVRLVGELNQRVYELLGLRESDRVLVEDFVHVRRFANKGKVVEETAGLPDEVELKQYGKMLQSELDAFFDDSSKIRHRVSIQFDDGSKTAMAEIELLRDHRGPRRVKVERAGTASSVAFERARRQMRERRSQWLYFERNLRLYEGSRVFLLKPLQRIHWLRSQALLDADTIIAETVAAGGR